MTTNKPEIVAWFKPASDATLNSVDAVITDRSMKDRPEISTKGFTEPLVRLSDYEALQAECEKLRADNSELLAKLAAMESQKPEPYDAGCLNDYGGGNVSWWHDYIRAELDRAHNHYTEQFNAPVDPWNACCSCGHRYYAEMPTDSCPVCISNRKQVPIVSVPDVADEEMLEVGVETLRRGLKLFPDNLCQVISNVWEDMYESAPSHSQQSAVLPNVSCRECNYYAANSAQCVKDGNVRKGLIGQCDIARPIADRCPSHESKPCHECGGDGAGGEHEDDCSQQVAPDVTQLVEALKKLVGAVRRNGLTLPMETAEAQKVIDKVLAAYRKGGES